MRKTTYARLFLGVFIAVAALLLLLPPAASGYVALGLCFCAAGIVVLDNHVKRKRGGNAD